jgi:transglutaminase-like putative cysteine protease
MHILRRKNKMKKKVISILIALTLFGTIAFAGGAFDGIVKTHDKIYLDGELIYTPYNQPRVDSNGNPIIGGITDNGQTYVPLRGILEYAGFDIEWEYGRIDLYSNKSKPTDYIQENRIVNDFYVAYAIQSNQKIEDKAKEIVAQFNAKSKIDKARALYEYVIQHMEYDEAAIERMKNDCPLDEVGAIHAFNDGIGICYDYATLYAVMCDAVGLNVRLIGGEILTMGDEGYYVTEGHAWNEVQIDSGDFIAIDATWGENGDIDGWNFTEYNHDMDNDGIDDFDDKNMYAYESEIYYVDERYSMSLLAEFENY